MHAPKFIPRCALSNQEFEIATKLRLGTTIFANLPTTCICGSQIDGTADHLLRCKQGNEWDTRHTAINQCVAAIIRSTHLPVSSEIVISNLTPPAPGYLPPAGRMDLVVTDSDFSTILADVTITHPNPSLNQQLTLPMMQPGYFSTNRENSKRTKYGQAARILGARFVPLVLETYGYFGSEFSLFLNKLANELFRREPNSDVEMEGVFKQKLKNLWINRISCTLQKANARLILSKISRTQQSVQRSAPRVAVDFSGASNWSL